MTKRVIWIVGANQSFATQEAADKAVRKVALLGFAASRHSEVLNTTSDGETAWAAKEATEVKA